MQHKLKVILSYQHNFVFEINTINKTDNNLKQLIQNPELEVFNAIGHKLYGTATATGLDLLAELAKELEALDHLDHIETLYQNFNKEMQIVINFLQQEVNKL